MFFVSLQCTLHPLQAIQLKPEYIWDSMLIYMSSYCKVCRQCRVHCKDTKTFPVAPRHTPVSYISWLNSMTRHNKLFKPPKRLISLILVFFETPCIITPRISHNDFKWKFSAILGTFLTQNLCRVKKMHFFLTLHFSTLYTLFTLFYSTLHCFRFHPLLFYNPEKNIILYNFYFDTVKLQ